MDFFESLNEKANRDGIIKRIAGGIIYDNKGRILLLKRRADDFMGGIYELPSGNLECGETIDEGLVREIKEETGLEVKKIGKFVNTFDYLSGSGKKSRQFNLEVEVESTENVFLTEHDEYKWMTYEEVENNENITDEVKYAVVISKYNK